MKTGRLLLILTMLCGAARASTVNIYMTNYVSGFADTNYFKIIPVGSNTLANGAVITRGIPIICWPNTNGFFSTNLQVGNYQITNAYVNLLFQSFNDTNTYNLQDILLPGFNTFAPTGVRRITSTNGSVIIYPPSGVGVVDLSATNAGGGGVFTAAGGTNIIATTNGNVVTINSGTNSGLWMSTSGFLRGYWDNGNLAYQLTRNAGSGSQAVQFGMRDGNLVFDYHQVGSGFVDSLSISRDGNGVLSNTTGGEDLFDQSNNVVMILAEYPSGIEVAQVFGVVYQFGGSNYFQGDVFSGHLWGIATLTNGLNYGNAFSSPGSGALSEQFGASATATAIQSSAFGNQAAATATDATAVGASALASSNNATALGELATASGRGSTAVGQNTFALHTNSTAIGINATTTADHQIQLGTSSEHVNALGDFSSAGMTNRSLLSADAVATDSNGKLVQATGISMTHIAQPGAIVTNGESLAITHSNQLAVDAAHAFVASNAFASSVAGFDASHELTNITIGPGLAFDGRTISSTGGGTNAPVVSADTNGTVRITTNSSSGVVNYALQVSDPLSVGQINIGNLWITNIDGNLSLTGSVTAASFSATNGPGLLVLGDGNGNNYLISSGTNGGIKANGFWVTTTNTGSGTLDVRYSYITNLTANTTLGPFAGVPSGARWEMFLEATNGNGVNNYTLTFPQGTIGDNGTTPAVYTITNGGTYDDFRVSAIPPGATSVLRTAYWTPPPAPLTPGYMDWWSADTLASQGNGATVATVSPPWTGVNGIPIGGVGSASPNPYVTNNYINTHTAVAYGGGGAGLISTQPAAVTAPWIAHIVALEIDNGNFWAFCGGTNGSGANYLVTDSGANTYHAYAGSSLQGGNSAPNMGAWKVYTIINSNSTSSSVLVNGTAVTTGAFGNNALEGFGIGTQGSSPQFVFKGFITDAVLYTNGLSWTQIQNNITSLRNRIGI